MKNIDVAHAWAHSDLGAVGSGNNLSFHGCVIYSYTTAVANKLASGVYLLTSEKYSVTASKHMSYIRMAAYGQVVSVPDVLADTLKDYRRNHDHLKKVVKELAEEYETRARSRKAWVLQGWVDAVREANWYNQYFKLKRVSIEEPEQAQEHYNKATHIFKRWKLHKTEHLLNHQNPRTCLRISKDGLNIETSRGIVMTELEGENIWRLMQQGKSSGLSTKVHGVRVSGFKLETIHSNGDAEGGCHLVPYSEGLQIAEHFGWG
jgi:hypothetical protein